MKMSAGRARQLKAFFANQPDVMLAYFFGSTARADATSTSDIDVAILLSLTLEKRLRAAVISTVLRSAIY